MLNPEHPAAILRHAWRNVRLDAIRAAAKTTIAELEELDRGSLSPRQPLVPHPSTAMTATEAALLTCCGEVRHESGMSENPAEYRGPVPDAAWAAAYAEELERYRIKAGQVLSRLLSA